MFTVSIPNAKNLKTPLAKIAAAVNTNTPIEECVLIEASEEHGLTLTARDSRTHQLKLSVPEAQVIHPGSCIVNASFTDEMVGTLKDLPLRMAVDEGQLIIKANTTITVPLFNGAVEDFPIQRMMPPTVTRIDAERLVRALRDAFVLSEKDEFITLVGESDMLKVYTRLNGRMFSVTNLRCEEPCEEPWSVAVPTQMLQKIPFHLVGPAEIRLDADALAITSGQEHLYVEQLATDIVSFLVDGLAGQKSDDYWIVKSDDLANDLRRAAIIQDKRGLQLAPDEEHLRATCRGAGGSVNSAHQMSETSGTLEPMFVDPSLLASAIKALDCVDLVGEQVKTVQPSFIDGEPDETITNLRLRDQDTPDYRCVIVSTVQVS